MTKTKHITLQKQDRNDKCVSNFSKTCALKYAYMLKCSQSETNHGQNAPANLLTIAVRENDVGTLSTKLEGSSLEVALGGHQTHLLSNLGRASERHLVHVHVARNRRARRRTVPGDDVDHTRGKSSLHINGYNYKKFQ